MRNGEGKVTAGPWRFMVDFKDIYDSTTGQVVNSQQLYPNGDPRRGAAQALFTPNRWHHLELYFKLNSAKDRPDGVFRFWDNGVLTHDYHTVVYLKSKGTGGKASPYDHSMGFYQWHYAPVYGGCCGMVKTQDDYLEIDQLYVSGVAYQQNAIWRDETPNHRLPERGGGR
jgi:hypothetical protein